MTAGKDNARRLPRKDVEHILKDGYTNVLVGGAERSQVGERVLLALLPDSLNRDGRAHSAAGARRQVGLVAVVLSERDLGEQPSVRLDPNETTEQLARQVRLVKYLCLGVVVVG